MFVLKAKQNLVEVTIVRYEEYEKELSLRTMNNEKDY